MAMPIGSLQMSTKRLFMLLQQSIRRSYPWKQRSAFNRNCHCNKSAQARAPIRGRTNGSAALFPIVALQAFGLPGIFKWGSQEDAAEPKPGESVAVQDDPDKATVTEADRLYTGGEVKALYEFLVQYKDSTNPEILWRLARATTDLGKHAILEDIKHERFKEAFQYIEKALALGNDNFAVHKWYAILLDYTGEIEGTKKRISNAFKVKEHFERALQLNPNDPTVIHSLGYWCFVFADLKWYERKIAAAFYATPPTSTYQEALEYFQKAEQMEPNFYSANLLMLGRTYMKLRDPVMAYTYLKKCAEYPQKTPDDKASHIEAVKLMKSMGIKGNP